MAETIMKWALENYAKGGHWIVETMSVEDIAETFKTLRKAQRYCALMQEQERACRNA